MFRQVFNVKFCQLRIYYTAFSMTTQGILYTPFEYHAFAKKHVRKVM